MSKAHKLNNHSALHSEITFSYSTLHAHEAQHTSKAWYLDPCLLVQELALFGHEFNFILPLCSTTLLTRTRSCSRSYHTLATKKRPAAVEYFALL